MERKKINMRAKNVYQIALKATYYHKWMYVIVNSGASVRFDENNHHHCHHFTRRSVCWCYELNHIENTNDNKHIRARREKFSYCWRFEQLRCSEKFYPLHQCWVSFFIDPNTVSSLCRAFPNSLNISDDGWIFLGSKIIFVVVFVGEYPNKIKARSNGKTQLLEKNRIFFGIVWLSTNWQFTWFQVIFLVFDSVKIYKPF